MKTKIRFIIALLALWVTILPAQSDRQQKVITPYTVRVWNITAAGGKGTLEKTLNTQIFANTIYYVEVSSSTAALSVAYIKASNADGFQMGQWLSGGFVPFSNPTSFAKDGRSMNFLIKTFTSTDFFTPLYMKVSQCLVPCGGSLSNITPFLFPQ